MQLSRAFQNRLALAAFKHSRGWADVSLAVLEPALIKDAQDRAQTLAALAHAAQPHPHHQQPQDYPPPPGAYYAHPSSGEGSMGPPAKRMRADVSSMAHPSQAGRQMYANDPYVGVPPAEYYQNGGHPGYVQPYGAGHHHPHASTSALPPNGLGGGYAPSPQGLNPFLNGGAHGGHHLGGSHVSALAGHAVQRAGLRGPPPRPSGPLSSSDPGFSSFVDAASVLSGLNRQLSDETGQEGITPRRDGARTPPRDKGKAAAAGGSPGEGNSADAAELMLFLAASPSPVQPKAHIPAAGLLGGASPMRGRRLFSGESEPGGDPAHSQSVASVFGDFHHSAGFNHRHSPPPQQSHALNAQHLGGIGLGPPPVATYGDPATPRDRQPSFGAPGGAWELFVNQSPEPSPQRLNKGGVSPIDELEEDSPIPIGEDVLKGVGAVPATSMAFLQENGAAAAVPAEPKTSPGAAGTGSRPFAVPQSAAKRAQQRKEREARGVSVGGEGGDEWP